MCDTGDATLITSQLRTAFGNVRSFCRCMDGMNLSWDHANDLVFDRQTEQNLSIRPVLL